MKRYVEFCVDLYGLHSTTPLVENQTVHGSYHGSLTTVEIVQDGRVQIGNRVVSGDLGNILFDRERWFAPRRRGVLCLEEGEAASRIFELRNPEFGDPAVLQAIQAFNWAIERSLGYPAGNSWAILADLVFHRDITSKHQSKRATIA